ncbi:MAG: serine/threonine-protein kinase [Solirubrobacterales bacterium]
MTARDLAERRLLAAGRRLGNRYVLRRPLGHGGMAAVWLATDDRLGRQVAVKVLSDTVADDSEFLDRFRREAKVAARLQHPNLVSVYDFDAGERPYLVMEYIEGGNLADRLAEGDPPEPEALARELLSALRHIHSNGVLHRDVKPENVLIDADGHARLTDFGIAQPTDATSLTQAGRVIGTESYMAPEVRSGEPATERSDLFATGTVLAEASSGGASAALWSLIDQLRDPDPERRPVSATAALAILERAATITPGPEPTKPFPARASRIPPERRRIAFLAALAVLAALVAVVLVILLTGGDEGGGQQAKALLGRPTTNEPSTTAQHDASSAGSDSGGSQDSAPPADQTSAAVTDDGAALNDQGYALIQSGDYDAAIPILQRAVDQLRGSSDQLTYGYALYNLGHALRLAGRPEEAIPILEQRLQIPDQRATVEAELAAARADAGATGGAEPKPEKPPKPGKGPKEGHGPPPSSSSGGVEGE